MTYVDSMEAALQGADDSHWFDGFKITEEGYRRALIGVERALGGSLITPEAPYDWVTLRRQISDVVAELVKGVDNWHDFQHVAVLVLERMHKQFEWGWLPYTSGYCAVRQPLFEAEKALPPPEEDEDEPRLTRRDLDEQYMWTDCMDMHPNEWESDKSGEMTEDQLNFDDRSELSPVEFVEGLASFKRMQEEADRIIAQGCSHLSAKESAVNNQTRGISIRIAALGSPALDDPIDGPLSEKGPFPRYWIDGELVTPVRFQTIITKRKRESYIDWLADYLYENEFPLPECQKELSDLAVDSSKATRLFAEIGIELGASAMAVEDCYEAFNRGLTPEQLREEELRRYEQGLRDGLIEDVPDCEDFGINQEEANLQFHILPLRLTRRLMREFRQQIDSGHSTEKQHGDEPYRALFSHIFHKLGAAKTLRVKLLHEFYDAYDANYCS